MLLVSSVNFTFVIVSSCTHVCYISSQYSHTLWKSSSKLATWTHFVTPYTNLVLGFLDRSVLLVSSVNFTFVMVSSCTCVLVSVATHSGIVPPNLLLGLTLSPHTLIWCWGSWIGQCFVGVKCELHLCYSQFMYMCVTFLVSIATHSGIVSPNLVLGLTLSSHTLIWCWGSWIGQCCWCQV